MHYLPSTPPPPLQKTLRETSRNRNNESDPVRAGKSPAPDRITKTLGGEN